MSGDGLRPPGGCYSTVPTHAFVGIVTVTRLLRRYSCHDSVSFIEEGEHDKYVASDVR
jgi:hypothetical protein